MKTVSDILTPLRKSGLTLKEIADLIGDNTAPISVSDYINCKRPPSDVRYAVITAAGFANGKRPAKRKAKR